MKEIYLHYLWKYKLIPFHKMKLTTGENFKIVYQGDYNAYESGPDFLNAKVEIDGLLWVGNVELHVRSKDWFLHNHHTDIAYETVILHVVYEENGNVLLNGSALPTLELKPIIDTHHFYTYAGLFKNKHTILCGTQLRNVQSIYLISLQEKALFQRLSRKTENLSLLTGSKDANQVLYFLLARAFGTKINQLPFEELTQRLPLSLLKKQNKKQQDALVQYASGMFTSDFSKTVKSAASNGKVNRSSWKFCGTRPGNSPVVRIQQFSAIVREFDFETSFLYLSKEQLLEHWMVLLSRIVAVKGEFDKVPSLTKSFKEQVIINCFVPFLFWYGQERSEEQLVEKSMEILRLLPSEQNSILDKWKKFNVCANNAAESQAFLEIFNEFCTRKKCLSCDIGIQLLSK